MARAAPLYLPANAAEDGAMSFHVQVCLTEVTEKGRRSQRKPDFRRIREGSPASSIIKAGMGSREPMNRVRMKRKPARRKAALPRALPLPPEWRLRRREGVVVLEALPLARIPWLVHGFSTRVGGASFEDGRRMLNLGYVEWDERSRVKENRRRFVGALGASEMEFVALRQFHSSLVRIFRRARNRRGRSNRPTPITNRAGRRTPPPFRVSSGTRKCVSARPSRPTSLPRV